MRVFRRALRSASCIVMAGLVVVTSLPERAHAGPAQRIVTDWTADQYVVVDERVLVCRTMTLVEARFRSAAVHWRVLIDDAPIQSFLADARALKHAACNRRDLLQQALDNLGEGYDNLVDEFFYALAEGRYETAGDGRKDASRPMTQSERRQRFAVETHAALNSMARRCGGGVDYQGLFDFLAGRNTTAVDAWGRPFNAGGRDVVAAFTEREYSADIPVMTNCPPPVRYPGSGSASYQPAGQTAEQHLSWWRTRKPSASQCFQGTAGGDPCVNPYANDDEAPDEPAAPEDDNPASDEDYETQDGKTVFKKELVIKSDDSSTDAEVGEAAESALKCAGAIRLYRIAQGYCEGAQCRRLAQR